jgi:SOS response regulatory protein OraA/RecX
VLRRTLHAAKYLSDPAYRRKIARQLNKGESLHALRRDLHYAQQGAITKPALADQTDQAWCLTVLTNAVITWTTEYYSLTVRQLRAAGGPVFWPTGAHPRPGRARPQPVTCARSPCADGCRIRARSTCSKTASAKLDPHRRGWTLHQLRHSALQHLAQAGRTAPELQAKSRHQHLASLGRYVRLGEETSARITAEADPAQRRRPR